MQILDENNWNEFVQFESDAAAGEGGIKKLMKKQLAKQQKMKNPRDAAPGTAGYGRTSVGLTKSMAVSESIRLRRKASFAAEVAKGAEDEPAAEEVRVERIERILKMGRKLITKEVFAIPKVLWTTQSEHPDEIKALDRAGFLIESYHAHAW